MTARPRTLLTPISRSRSRYFCRPRELVPLSTLKKPLWHGHVCREAISRSRTAIRCGRWRDDARCSVRARSIVPRPRASACREIAGHIGRANLVPGSATEGSRVVERYSLAGLRQRVCFGARRCSSTRSLASRLGALVRRFLCCSSLVDSRNCIDTRAYPAYI